MADILAPVLYGGILLPRRGTAASWTAANPTLAPGEIGVETDTGKFKLGNGSTAWNSAQYANPSDVDGAFVPPGGTTGQVLAKASNTDGDTHFIDAASGASGLSPAQAVTAGTSPNYESGVGTYDVNVLPAGTSGYAVAFQRTGDAYPFLAVTAVGDWVISDGTYDPTNHPVSFNGLQWSGSGGISLRGGGTSGIDLHADGVHLGAAVFGSSLPTADPVVAGQLWNNAGVVTVSAG